MLSLFAVRGALLFFKPLPLRRIGGDGHKMLRESRGDHRRLSLLTIFLHVRVTRTGIASGTVFNSPMRDITCVLSRTAKHNLQVVHYFQKKKYYCRDKIEYNTYDSLRSTQ